MNVKKLTKFVALFDIHVGWEKIKSRGVESIKATHSLPAIKAALAFMKDFKPDALILGGDQLNFGPISHWNKGKPRLIEGFSIKKEMDFLLNTVLKPIEAIIPFGGTKYWFKGNHEVWLQDHIDANPGLEGLCEPENYLKLKQNNYEIFEQGETGSLGKLHFVHGDVVLKNGSTVNPAKTLVNAYRRNIRAGHLHTYSAALETTPVDATDYHTGIVVPSLSSRNPAFVKSNPNMFCNGLLMGWVYPDGSFTDNVIIINKGKFTYNGKLYDGN